jgi:hypothetical protein
MMSEQDNRFRWRKKPVRGMLIPHDRQQQYRDKVRSSLRFYGCDSATDGSDNSMLQEQSSAFRSYGLNCPPQFIIFTAAYTTLKFLKGLLPVFRHNPELSIYHRVFAFDNLFGFISIAVMSACARLNSAVNPGALRIFVGGDLAEDLTKRSLTDWYNWIVADNEERVMIDHSDNEPADLDKEKPN